jgi:hypothetical protein
MKKLLALTIALAFFVGIPVYVLADGPYRNASEFCKDNGDLGFRHGICVSIVENLLDRGDAAPVDICKLWELLDPLSFYGEYENLGQCINDLRIADN